MVEARGIEPSAYCDSTYASTSFYEFTVKICVKNVTNLQ